MDNKEMIALAERVQKRIQRQLLGFRFIAKRDEIEKEFKKWEKINEDIYSID
jgi:hypothetical protein